jgi:hypothetical protein
MNPEESAAPVSCGSETPTHAENLARLAALKERNARLHQEYINLAAELDRLEADAARARLDARRAKVNNSRGRSLWPWAVPLALCIMVAGNTLLAISDFIPANLHAKGTSFVLTMTAYFITCLAFIRSGRHRSTPSS